MRVATSFMALLLTLTGCASSELHLLPVERFQRATLRFEVIPIVREAGGYVEQGGPKDLTAARALLNLARERAGDTPEILDGFGCISLRLGRTEEAIWFFSEALKRDAEFAMAHSHLGAALFSAGRKEEAESEIVTALKLNPFERDARRNLVILQVGDRPIAAGSREEEELFKSLYLIRRMR